MLLQVQEHIKQYPLADSLFNSYPPDLCNNPILHRKIVKINDDDLICVLIKEYDHHNISLINLAKLTRSLHGQYYQ